MADSTSQDDAPTIVTVPTALGRQDGFIDLAICVGLVLAVWEAALHGWIFVALVIPVLIVACIEMASGEPASDAPVVGLIAAGFRSALGQRRAHEWLFAWWRYFKAKTWPDWNVIFAYQSRRRVRAARHLGRRVLDAARSARATGLHLHRADAADHRNADVLETP